MALEIKARFGFDNGSPFKGRAYVFHTLNDSDSREEIGESYRYLHSVIETEQFNQLKDSGILFTNAIMWKDKEHPMIDFFGWNFENRESFDWRSNPEIYTWVTRNGVLVPGREFNDITCGKGLIIMGEEEKHRLATSSLNEYLTNAPYIQNLNYRAGDFTCEDGKARLSSVLTGN